MRRRFGNDRGVGVLSTVFGLTFFLGFLLFATQLCLRLYQSSMLDADAYQAARAVARDAVQRGGPAAIAAAMAAQTTRLEERYRSARPSIQWSDAMANDVVVDITIHPPSEVVTGLDSALGLTSIHRTARVHRETEP